MPLAHVVWLQAELFPAAQRLMLVNVLVVLAIVAFASGIVLAVARRSMKRQVEAERLAAMGTATARILHQVKNPLQTIILHAEMLMDPMLVEDEAARREVSEAIISESSRVVELLAELSAYATGSKRKLELVPLDLREFVGDLARSEIREAEHRGIQVIVGPMESLQVRADPYYLRQALDNVLRNAREALAEDGRERPGRIEIRLKRRSGDAIVEIRDNGPGISPDRLKRIFEPFVTTKPKGMGLGLAICREIVESHGGRVEIRSSPGSGTTVSLIIPVYSGGNGRDRG
ncbi:MAG TPA: HAMP domain-containing sensor histidine kinase [Longimicrobiales bacterium]|nr:HAMP domain-containing sensor histidine kinase [Longimicrobiales bacterium]